MNVLRMVGHTEDIELELCNHQQATCTSKRVGIGIVAQPVLKPAKTDSI